MMTKSPLCSSATSPRWARPKTSPRHGPFKKGKGPKVPLKRTALTQGGGLIVSVGDMGHQSLAHGCPPAKAGHLGVGSAFIHENQAGGGGRSRSMPMGRFSATSGRFCSAASVFFIAPSPVGAATSTVEVPRAVRRGGPTRPASRQLVRHRQPRRLGPQVGVLRPHKWVRGSTLPRSHGAAGPAARRPHKTQGTPRYRVCSCLVHRVARCARAQRRIARMRKPAISSKKESYMIYEML